VKDTTQMALGIAAAVILCLAVLVLVGPSVTRVSRKAVGTPHDDAIRTLATHGLVPYLYRGSIA
jgi:hypothetical protein